MCIVLKSDVIVASTLKRMDNFYNNVMNAREMDRETFLSQEDFPGYQFSINDCIERQQHACFSSLGVVVANSDYGEFERFLDNKSIFERCGVDCYKLTQDAECLCLTDKINLLIDNILENAYSVNTLVALDII